MSEVVEEPGESVIAETSEAKDRHVSLSLSEWCALYVLVASVISDENESENAVD